MSVHKLFSSWMIAWSDQIINLMCKVIPRQNIEAYYMTSHKLVNN